MPNPTKWEDAWYTSQEALRRVLALEARYAATVYTLIYADEATRLAATGFTAGDVGRVAWQQSDDTFWQLTSYSPITWTEVPASSAIPRHATTHLPGGTDGLTTGVPVSIGFANAEGSAAAFARRDHVHSFPAVADVVGVWHHPIITVDPYGRVVHIENGSATGSLQDAYEAGGADPTVIELDADHGGLLIWDATPTLGADQWLHGVFGPGGTVPYWGIKGDGNEYLHGDIIFANLGSSSRHTIGPADATAGDTTGDHVYVRAAAGFGGGRGGDYEINAGNGGDTGRGGDHCAFAGDGGATSGRGGDLALFAGWAQAGSRGGDVAEYGGTGGQAGGVFYEAGEALDAGETGGSADFWGGTGTLVGGPVTVWGGTGVTGGSVDVCAGFGSAVGGDVTVNGGYGPTYGNVLLAAEGGRVLVGGLGVSLPVFVDDEGYLTTTGTSDPFAQYALLAGRAGGQILIGGTEATDKLTLRATGEAYSCGMAATTAFAVTRGGGIASTLAWAEAYSGGGAATLVFDETRTDGDASLSPCGELTLGANGELTIFGAGATTVLSAGGVLTLKPLYGPQTALLLDIEALGVPGILDSHAWQMTGRSYDASAHVRDWRAHVDMASQAGYGGIVFETSLDAGPWSQPFGIWPDAVAIKTHDAFAGSGSIAQTGAAQTTTSTTDSVWTLTLTDTYVYGVEATIKARNTDGTERAMWKFIWLCHREGGGAVLDHGGTAHLEFAASDNPAGWTCDVDVSGNDVRIRVTGEAGKTINWVADVSHQAVSGSA